MEPKQTITVMLTDKTNGRNQPHKNLILCPGEGVLEFKGQDIAPSIRIIEVSTGKDSLLQTYHVWTVKMDASYRAFVFSQDWYKSVWFTATTWAVAVAQFRNKVNQVPFQYETARQRWRQDWAIPDVQIERCIRSVFPEYACTLDDADAAFVAAGNQVAAIFTAQAKTEQNSRRRRRCTADRIFNLTKQLATPKQTAVGVEDLPEDFRNVLIPMLEFTAPPSKDELHQRALRIRGLLSSYLRGGITSRRDNHLRGASVLIGGFPALMTQLEVALLHAGAHVCYTFSVGEPDSGDARFTWVG